MISASATEHVPAPLPAVFAFMNEPQNQERISPSLVESRETGRMQNGGARASYVYKMAGVPFRGEVTAREFAPHERIVFGMTGDIEGEIRWEFTEEDGGTRVTYSARYEIPGSVLATLARPIAAKYNERELRSTLANLRERFEA